MTDRQLELGARAHCCDRGERHVSVDVNWGEVGGRRRWMMELPGHKYEVVVACPFCAHDLGTLDARGHPVTGVTAMGEAVRGR